MVDKDWRGLEAKEAMIQGSSHSCSSPTGECAASLHLKVYKGDMLGSAEGLDDKGNVKPAAWALWQCGYTRTPWMGTRVFPLTVDVH